MARELIPVVQRSYDLCAQLYEQVDRFPRAQRGLLGRVMLDDALHMLVLLTVANRKGEKGETLAEASGRLDALRITVRLGKRLGFVSNGAYARLAESMDEVGRMVGGWLKSQGRGNGHTPARPSPERGGGAGSARRGQGGVRFTMMSPTIEKYLRRKLEHPQAVVVVTVGAFCQTFFEDAVFCGQTLRFAVRNVAATSEQEAILACGFPRAKLDKYAALLRDAGREVHLA